jgi:crotonobetaine/carnitine-CoA ligase
MTETIAAVITQRTTDGEAGVLGEPTPACDVELREPEGDGQTGVGEVGEITVGGTPGRTLFAGYFEDEEATSAAFRGARLRTGDLATRQADGRYRFVGRRNDVLKVSGENVSTVEVEAVLASHPGVFEAAVVGAPDRVRDEVPVAFVVRAAGADELDEAALLAYAAETLAPSKRPRAVHFVDQLPRTSVGKVRKFMLPFPSP